MASASYDDANRLIQRGAATLTYDAGGNLTSDGVNTYTWDARGQLASITSGMTASFQYDAFGRRVGKTVNGQATTYLYDGATVVQELESGTLAANMLKGGGDQVFTRSDADGTRSLLHGSVGSTLALADSTGTLVTQYTYDPFGGTAAMGASSGNPMQFSGRENDSTGLYYYRARYYSPDLQRFISEDPIGFIGGINGYAYVDNDPVNLSDASGLQGGPENLGQGWTARVDQFAGGQGFEIHVYNPAGKEAGIVSGTQGWIGKHRLPDNVRPPNIPESVVNTVNGLNLDHLRRRGAVPPKGGANVARGGYLAPGRILFGPIPQALNLIGTALGEYDAVQSLASRACQNNRTPFDQFCHESEQAGHPEFYMSPIGPLKNPCRYSSGGMV